MYTVLHDHHSAETAHVIQDYPYGYTLRCKRRVWVETRPGFGQRFVAQTTNPRAEGEVWNKPKAGGYSPICIIFRNEETGHIEQDGLSQYSKPEDVINFLAKYPDSCADNYRAKMLKGIQRLHEKAALLRAK